MLVVARVVGAGNERKLYMAGADRVVAPQQVGAERLAALALHPDLAEFIDLVVRGQTLEFRVAEFSVRQNSTLVGKTLRNLDLWNQTGALVLAVSTPDGGLSVNPEPDVDFQADSIIVGFGPQDQLDALGKLASVPVSG